MKGILFEKTKRQQKTKKKEILKGRQRESNEKTPRDKNRTSAFRKNKRKNRGKEDILKGKMLRRSFGVETVKR